MPNRAENKLDKTPNIIPTSNRPSIRNHKIQKFNL